MVGANVFPLLLKIVILSTFILKTESNFKYQKQKRKDINLIHKHWFKSCNIPNNEFTKAVSASMQYHRALEITKS